MEHIHSIEALRERIKSIKAQGKTVGFVPTMGYFHEGHLSLMRTSKAKTDVTVVSIFVNPTQFGPGEDYETYPRDMERDLMLCEAQGVDIVFTPSVTTMYPEGYSTYVETEGPMTKALCGASRPGHFKGVTSVVAKLFLIVAPHYAFFGQKDAQQVAVVEKMVRDLNFETIIVPCDIVREADGLAMSSRNVYLSAVERQEALVLNQALQLAKQALADGERSAAHIKARMTDHIHTAKSASIDYIDVVSAIDLQPIERLEGDVLIALAVRFHKTRLIDNLRIRL